MAYRSPLGLCIVAAGLIAIWSPTGVARQRGPEPAGAPLEIQEGSPATSATTQAPVETQKQETGTAAQASQPSPTVGPRVVTNPKVVPNVKHDVSPALRDIPTRAPQSDREPHGPMRWRQPRQTVQQPDAALQTSAPAATAPSPILNFEGVGNVDGVLPPDTNGDLGPNHYVQWVNKTYAVYSRSGSLLYGPTAGNTVWSGFGGPCETTNDGDPIVLYDHLADRWLMSQFAIPNNLLGLFVMAPFYQCIAVSQTPDPTGAYYRYQFEFSKLNDYPKFGVWPDGYYMTINQFKSITLEWAGQGVVAFDRAAMLAGQSASMIYFDLFSTDPNLGGGLPSDLDGPAPPPGSPNYFVQWDDDAVGYSPDQLRLYRFQANWASPSSSTFTGPYVLPVAAFDSNMCAYERACIPQPGTTAKLDAMSDRLMYRLQYRNFGSHETLVVNHTVDVDGTDHAGVRWYEIRNPGGTPVIHQQGTYAPDNFHRWMGSAAMDAAGNLALVYNVGGSTLAPSIRYAGRLATDPPGTLGQGETDIIIGAGSQTHTASRWGDYGMISVDPVDGCTFWATTEYYGVTSQAGWQTRIGAFRLPGCGNFGPPPNAPTNLAATAASATQIDLSWTDQSGDESGFNIERCTGTAAVCTASGSFTLVGQTAAGVTTYADASAQGSTTYSYRVRAFNFGGSSDYSNIVDATTPAPPPPPTLTVTASTPQANEAGPTNGTFTISRGTAQTSAISVNFTLAGTAVNGTDYTSLPTTATIPAGAASVDVQVTPIDDALIESNETVVLTLAASAAYVIGSPSSGTVTIVSDDAAVDFVVTTLTAPLVGGAGLSLQVSDTTANQGSAASQPSVTSFYLSVDALVGPTDPEIGTRTVPALAVGATSTVSTTVNIPLNTASGLYWILAKADGPGQFSEVNENNNVRAVSIRIGPDLAVTALTAPAIGGAGGTIVVTDTSANQGGGPADASETRFYLSSNYLLDDADTLLGGRAAGALAPAGSSTASTTLTIPPNAATGLHYLIAKADGLNAVTEPLETNNARYVTIRVGPDLTVTGLTAPYTAGPGGTVVVTDTTANQGGGSAGASETRFYLSGDYLLDGTDTPLGGRGVGALAPSGSSTASTTLTIPANAATGLRYLIAKADGPDSIAEPVENNNTRYVTIQIGPDLTISAISAPPRAASGGSIAVTETTKNTGAGTAGSSTTAIYLSSNYLFEASDTRLTPARSVGTLLANGSSTATTTVALPSVAPGVWYLIARADDLGEVPETSEANNTRYTTVLIGPDLTVTLITAPSSVVAGSTISVSDTVRNSGVDTAGASVTRIYLSTNMAFDASDTFLGERSVASIGYNASNTGPTMVTIPQGLSGTHYLIAVADGAGVVAESNEANNALWRGITINPQ